MKNLFLVIVLLAGCTIPGPSLVDGKDDCGASWTYTGNPIPESRWSIVETNDVFLKCLFEEKAEACSVRYLADDNRWSGIIYLPNEDGVDYCHSREYYKRHEGLHLMGWSHPNWARGN